MCPFAAFGSLIKEVSAQHLANYLAGVQALARSEMIGPAAKMPELV